MIRGSIHQEDITVVNIYEPNIATLKYMNQKQIQLKGKMKNMNLTPHSQQQLDHPDGKSINNQQIGTKLQNKWHNRHIQNILCSTIAEFFSKAHGTEGNVTEEQAIESRRTLWLPTKILSPVVSRQRQKRAKIVA